MPDFSTRKIVGKQNLARVCTTNKHTTEGMSSRKNTETNPLQHGKTPMVLLKSVPKEQEPFQCPYNGNF